MPTAGGVGRFLWTGIVFDLDRSSWRRSYTSHIHIFQVFHVGCSGGIISTVIFCVPYAITQYLWLNRQCLNKKG